MLCLLSKRAPNRAPWTGAPMRTKACPLALFDTQRLKNSVQGCMQAQSCHSFAAALLVCCSVQRPAFSCSLYVESERYTSFRAASLQRPALLQSQPSERRWRREPSAYSKQDTVEYWGGFQRRSQSNEQLTAREIHTLQQLQPTDSASPNKRLCCSPAVPLARRAGQTAIS